VLENLQRIIFKLIITHKQIQEKIQQFQISSPCLGVENNYKIACLRQMLSSFANVEFEPSHHGAENLFFRAHIELITRNYVDQLRYGKQKKLFTLHDFCEIVLSKFVCDAKELSARMCVCKRPNSQAVGRVELSLEELAAYVLDLGQLQEARRG
jgi:hypothetical protein